MISETVNSKKNLGRVLVAMSGGVDSSVAAALLVEQGYDVVGVTMQVWDYTKSSCEVTEGNGTCCSSIDVDDARSVCDRLGIPFYVMNCEAKFQSYVIDEFVSSYLEGKTPIPCVNCNTYLKFDHLIQRMEELECDYLATGHYAKIENRESAQPALVTSTDDWKDQTYFLFTLDPKIVSRLLFPVGHLKKEHVRELALKMNLPVAKKKDSTGICFIGKGDYGDFIENSVEKELLRPGQIRRFPNGEILGEHTGIHKFTYGQRKGIGIYAECPLYVVKIDAATATVWLGEEQYLYAKTLRVEKLHWLADVQEGESLRVKIRFQHAGATAKISKKNHQALVEFDEPQRSITPGQAAVMYRGNQLLGGGWIVGAET